LREVADVFVFLDQIYIFTLAHTDSDQPNRLTRPEGFKELKANLFYLFVLPDVARLPLLLAMRMKRG